MAKIAVRRLFVDPPQAADVVGYKWYYGDPGDDITLLSLNSQTMFVVTSAPQLWIGDGSAEGGDGLTLPEGRYQFAVVAVDDAGNESDLYQHPDWVNVDIDVTPPDPPTGGGIESRAA